MNPSSAYLTKLNERNPLENHGNGFLDGKNTLALSLGGGGGGCVHTLPVRPFAAGRWWWWWFPPTPARKQHSNTRRARTASHGVAEIRRTTPRRRRGRRRLDLILLLGVVIIIIINNTQHHADAAASCLAFESARRARDADDRPLRERRRRDDIRCDDVLRGRVLEGAEHASDHLGRRGRRHHG